jgi:transmembrane protein EpsG
MTVFWLNLSIVYAMSLFSRYFAKPESLQPEPVRPNPLLVGIAVIVLILVSGLRSNIGDTGAYMHSYRVISYSWDQIDFMNDDFGFNLLQGLLQQINDDPQTLILFTAFCTNQMIVAVLYFYSRLLELSLYVYITSGMYLTSMNGIRQYLAAAIIFVGTRFLLKGNWKAYFLICLLAATIHRTALIMLPIYFMVRRKAWTGQTCLLLGAAVFIVFGFNEFSALLFSLIEDTQYGHYQHFAEGGAHVLRVVINAVPLIIAFAGRHKLRSLYPGIDIIVNMTILGAVFMIISTQNWIFARFAIYFGLYQLILLAWIVKAFRGKDQKLIYYGIVVCYFIYYFYESVITLGIQYKSNYLVL